MQVREVMSEKPEFMSAEATIQDAAKRMKDQSCGCVPVASNDRLVGILTDRDIAIAAIAEGKGLDEKVGNVVAKGKVLYCFENDDIGDVLRNMSEQHVQRLVVLNDQKNKDFVGMISVSDIADKCSDKQDLSQAIAQCCKHYQ